jgi:hypothetical protein
MERKKYGNVHAMADHYGPMYLCFMANIPNTYTAILSLNLPWHVDRKIFQASIDILKKSLID